MTSGFVCGRCAAGLLFWFLKLLSRACSKRGLFALAGVAQWIEHQPANQRVASSSPSQGTCLGCRPGPQWGVRERQPHTDVSLPLFLPIFPFLKVNKQNLLKNSALSIKYVVFQIKATRKNQAYSTFRSIHKVIQ